MAKLLMAMSGGIDSTVAALLLQKEGYEVIAATMSLLPEGRAKTCSNKEDLELAAKISKDLGLDHRFIDLQEAFTDQVIAPFVEAYEAGFTPNPCIECNRLMKFAALYKIREDLGCDYIASGHYARISYDEERGRYRLLKAVDQEKDQSYVLYNLNQEQLAHTLFPLGKYTKEEVRQIAKEAGLVNYNRKESQDICFIPDGDYVRFLKEFTGKTYRPGNFVDREGKVLGRHEGIVQYTIGQRRGLGLAHNKRLFVIAILPERNEIVLGEAEDLLTSGLVADRLKLIITKEELSEKPEVTVRTRYQQKEQAACVSRLENDRLELRFREKQKSPAPGQALVLYHGDEVLGGGRIIRVLRD